MLQRALNSWSEWGLGLTAEPGLMGPLDGGLTNRSYLLEGDRNQWVLRLNAGNSAQLGIDRVVEQRILAVTAGAGLSPRKYHCDPELGILVSEYLPRWRPDAVTEPELKQLAEQMSRLHQLDVAGVPVVDYLQYTESYVRRLQEKSHWSTELAELRAQHLPHLQHFQASPVATARLCHHDSSPSHWRLQQGELCLIDWEYAALRDPACDLALLAESWQLSPQQVTIMLAHYDGDVGPARLADAQWVCHYVNQLWFALQKINVQHEN